MFEVPGTDRPYPYHAPQPPIPPDADGPLSRVGPPVGGAPGEGYDDVGQFTRPGPTAAPVYHFAADTPPDPRTEPFTPADTAGTSPAEGPEGPQARPLEVHLDDLRPELRDRVDEPTRLLIGPARPEDAEAIGALRAEGWREQYSGLPGVDAEWVEGEVARITSPENTANRAGYIAESLQPGARNFWHVVREAGSEAVVGYVEARQHDDGGQELRSIHVSSELRSHGIGQALLGAAHDWFDPTQPAFLDVGQENHRAQALYTREPNNYLPTDHTYTYGQLGMLRMERGASQPQSSDDSLAHTGEAVPNIPERELSYDDRVEVPPEFKDWSIDWPDYDPPEFTTEWVRTVGVEQGRTDPDSPADVDFSTRPSFMGEYTFGADGRPLNPEGRQGIADRGDLTNWGPNYAADPVVVASDPVTSDRKILLVRREDTNTWALPGGMVDPGEHVSRAAVRELGEEAGIDLRKLQGEVIYEGYVDDPRNTDNAWIETTARLFRLTYTPEPTAGDDATDARWFNCNSMEQLLAEIRELEGLDEAANPLYASHDQIIEQALVRA